MNMHGRLFPVKSQINHKQLYKNSTPQKAFYKFCNEVCNDFCGKSYSF